MDLQAQLDWGSRAAALLPRGLGEWVADRCGDLAARLAPGLRDQARRNLELLLERPPAPGVERRAFRAYARYYLGMMRLAYRDPEQAIGSFSWDGVEALDQALERGRGAVVLTAHLGHWDLLGIALARRYGSMCAFVERLPSDRAFAFYTRVRGRHGVRVAPAGSPGRLAIRTLAWNGVVGLAADRPFGRSVSEIPVAAALLEVPTGGIRLAVRTGAALLAGFAVRESAGFRIHIGPDWTPHLGSLAPTRDPLHEATRLWGEALRAAIARHPDQWCLFHPLRDGRDAAAKLEAA